MKGSGQIKRPEMNGRLRLMLAKSRRDRWRHKRGNSQLQWLEEGQPLERDAVSSIISKGLAQRNLSRRWKQQMHSQPPTAGTPTQWTKCMQISGRVWWGGLSSIKFASHPSPVKGNPDFAHGWSSLRTRLCAPCALTLSAHCLENEIEICSKTK